MADAAPPVAAETPTPLFGDTFTDVGADYVLGRKLGSGNFAKVVHGVLRKPQPQWRLKEGEAVAVKVVKKPGGGRRSAAERVGMLRAEVEILRSINHPNIVRLYTIYESPARLYLVMEVCVSLSAALSDSSPRLRGGALPSKWLPGRARLSFADAL